MARWGFWDWIAYTCLGIAAFGLAGGTAMKDSPGLFQKLPPIFSSSVWGYVPAILFAIGSFILAVRFVGSFFEKPKQGPEIASSELIQTPPPPKERVFVDVTPQYLIGLSDGHTTAAAARLLQPYIGKWIKVSGEIFDVNPPDIMGRPSIMVTFPGEKSKYALMWFDKTKWDHLAAMHAGQKVSIQGEILNASNTSLLLQDCEFVAD